jgi:mono/diheme cytochrome c family protein
MPRVVHAKRAIKYVVKEIPKEPSSMHLRTPNRRTSLILAAISAAALLALLAPRASHSQSAPKPPKSAKTAASADAERGRYLEEEVARCWECHTPVGIDGTPDRANDLQGGPVWIQPVHPMGNWSENAPKLAGLASYTEDQMEQVLEKGIGANGRAIQPPMHVYHLNHADATAIIAYLRSLPSQ